jgi:cardiolipin synthase A/B
VKLLIQPESGVAPLVAAIKKAKKSVDIVIFRFDRAEIEAALQAAAKRGVSVSALITYTNRGGEKSLRKLEMRLLDAGVTVSRTADDLVRYHDKLLIVDRRVLHVLSFNFTHLDIDHSRGFGIVTKKSKLVQEALKLLAADRDRTRYVAGVDNFVVSPVNARKQLLALIGRAKKELLIYDPKIDDAEIMRALNERAKTGVDVRVIGSVGKKSQLNVRRLNGFRLHTRTIVCDRREAFVGSQSLRKAELDARREVGLIVRDK